MPQSGYVHRRSVTSFLPPVCAALLTPAALEIWAYESCLPSLKDQPLIWLKALSAATQTSQGLEGWRE